MRKKKPKREGRDSPSQAERDAILKNKKLDDKVPKAYRLDKPTSDSSDDSSIQAFSEDEAVSLKDKSDEDSGLDSDTETSFPDKLGDVQVSSLLSDMERLKEDLIRRNEYDKLKEKCKKSDSDDDWRTNIM